MQKVVQHVEADNTVQELTKKEAALLAVCPLLRKHEVLRSNSLLPILCSRYTVCERVFEALKTLGGRFWEGFWGAFRGNIFSLVFMT